jgi:hypothetical protein
MKPNEIINCLKYVFFELTERELEYVILRLFEYSNQYMRLEFNKIFIIFNPNNWITRDERFSNSPLF